MGIPHAATNTPPLTATGSPSTHIANHCGRRSEAGVSSAAWSWTRGRVSPRRSSGQRDDRDGPMGAGRSRVPSCILGAPNTSAFPPPRRQAEAAFWRCRNRALAKPAGITTRLLNARCSSDAPSRDWRTARSCSSEIAAMSAIACASGRSRSAIRPAPDRNRFSALRQLVRSRDGEIGACRSEARS